MADLNILKTELTTDPLARGYAAMTDQQAADSLNTVDREGPADQKALLQYLTLERFRTGSLYGRLKLLAETRPIRAGNAWEMPPVPLGVADADIIPTMRQIAAAAAILRFVDTDTGTATSLLDSRIDSHLNSVGPNQGEAIGSGDKTAIQALSQNQQSRGMEIGYGIVRVHQVTAARAV